MNENENKQIQLAHIRHSLAHLLGAAILELYPTAKLTLGPAIDNGFYYDADIAEPVNEKDIIKIEQKMRQIAKTWAGFEKEIVSAENAKNKFSNNEYKHELINGVVEKGEEISLYTSGEFTDLCRGGHVESFKDIDMGGWKLDKIAGAYWRGDEKNKMLTRVYGLAFENKEALANYELMIIEAEKRDHRKLAKDLNLFTISELVGSGLPLWKPNGTVLRRMVTDFLWDLHKNRGYNWVTTPHLAKEALYETSGHAGHYMDDMFSVFGGTSQEKFYVKPMNCPHHMQIFSSENWSYRDMPVRYFEPAVVYRDEKTGQLSGLTRVRSITQDDGHLFCRVDQIGTEVKTIVDIIKEFYTTMGLIDGYRVRLSLRDPENKQNYLGSDEVWQKSEQALTDICNDQKLPYFEGLGEAAFYGPKLDFMFKDAIGREHQLATVQIDFNLPERFDLNYINETGAKERPVVIHRAIAGSLERFLGVAIEHFAGAFPVWMAPVQIAVLPVSNEHHGEYAQKVFEDLRNAGIRAQLISDDSLGKRIRNTKMQKIPYQIIIGDKERDSQTLTVEGRHDEKVENITVNDFIARIQNEIKDRTNN
ncbi:MAG: threonyl-tRNA synthetase [Bacteroidota bacterium]|jgi:threonyl-tRNA synthetase|nr:threonyl-tRNA synthetase [Bacteroidota bacterium]